ncbi:MAG: Vitamin B12 dependent methionine synthase activation subunit [Oscillospiraceae bacterium]|nr:Vitamin B12 dependent methionine synthase activation subunit [Oscillospiraceae bacterium]
MSIVFTETFGFLPYDRGEILRYSGTRGQSDDIDALLDECLEEIDGKTANRVCYSEFEISQYGATLDLGFAKTNSLLLKKHLSDCDRIVVFAATIGIETDRLIAKYSRVSPARALMFQAIGAERIEALCNAFDDTVKNRYVAKGERTVPRVSPGYGDIELEMQRKIFSVLDCPRKIGLSLNDSLLMSPSKSVTAIIGVSQGNEICTEKTGCAVCGYANCEYRRDL